MKIKKLDDGVETKENPEYLYGYNGRKDVIEKAKVVKVMPKTYKVNSSLAVYDYRSYIPKDHINIATSPTAAVEVYIRNCKRKIEDYKILIAYEEIYIDIARKLL
jgi:hypothetical protein